MKKEFRFTLKQLYGYSIMNWKQYKIKLEKAVFDRVCSFCEDSKLWCGDCKIDPEICQRSETEGLFNAYFTIYQKLYESVNNLINALTIYYNKLGEVK